MKTAFKILIVIGCMILAPVFFVLFAFKNSLYSAALIETQLDRARAYDQIVSLLREQVDAAIEKGDREDPMTLVGPFLKKEITPEYLRKKANMLINDVDAYLRGKTTTSPVVSFNDLKEILLRQNKKLVTDLTNMSEQLKKQRDQMTAEAKQSGSSEQIPEIPDFDLGTLIAQDLSIPVGEYLAGLRVFQKVVFYGVWVCGVMLIFSLFLIALLSMPLQSALRWVGMTLGLVGISVIPLYILMTSLSHVFLPMIVQNISGNASVWATLLLNVLLQPFLAAFAKTGGYILLGIFICSIGLLLSSLFIHSTQPSNKK